ncbi:GYDIA family GHMP kinase [Flavobacteriaceae bacterium]|nr:GYDIA family GHMP kinase [Flavobacteriaceae bacterium]|tara:strand:- start:54 stop:950 length:897 start_codon:yes stop_codon:yes gene_type:complete
MEVYSNGKVLLTGEYVILDGALSLAAPTKFGQHLKYQENLSNLINWKSINFDGNIWFECLITSDTLKVKSTSSKKISNKLVEIINFIREYNPSFLKKCGSDISTNLTFEKNLGLGSSSTLISNLSKISGVNPYTINNKIFKGSGYDIACAESISPILYKLDKDQKIINEVSFKPSFNEHIYFVYLNKKQNSISEIKKYNKNKASNSIINEISDITSEILVCNSIDRFNELIEAHELIISKLISKQTVKDHLFKDFDGYIKSLGAWGGDMIMVTSQIDPSKYFTEKGYSTIFKFKELLV